MLRCSDTIRPANDTAIRARHLRRAFLYVTVALATLFGGSSSYAGEIADFRVNDDAGSVHQADPRIAVAPGGAFAVVWSDKRLNANSNEIFLQCFDSAGVPIGANRRVTDDAVGGYKSQPAIASDVDGHFMAVWLDYRGGYPSYPQVYSQRFDAAGSALGGNVPVTDSGVFREAPDLALSSWGGVIVWGEWSEDHWGIYGQRLDTVGNPVGAVFRANDVVDSARHAPRVACSPLGWFVVVWQDKRMGNNDIFVQRLSETGQRLGPNVKVNTDGSGAEQAAPAVATDGAGRFTVVWTDYRNGPSSPDVYAARFDTTMTALTGNIRLNSVGTIRSMTPSIAADRMGNTAMVWSDSVTSGWDIVGQMIDAEGLVQEAGFVGSTSTDFMQYKPDVALDGEYRYLVWVDKREDISSDIYASVTRYNTPGLVASPVALDFEMRQGGPVPPVQHVEVGHTGYNRVAYEVVSQSKWLSVSPESGMTPDSLAITVASDTLPNGTYQGYVRVMAPMVSDSAIVIAVRLEIRSAVLNMSPDTIRVTMPVGYDTVFQEVISITNTGLGLMTWTATEEATWLSLSSSSGSAPSEVVVEIDGRALDLGSYEAAVVVAATAAENSPDTVIVVLDVRSDLRVLTVSPGVFEATVVAAGDFTGEMVINNIGGGELAWSLNGLPEWLIASHSAGTAPDTVLLGLVGVQLGAGVNAATLVVEAPGAYNQTMAVPVQITYAPMLIDTIVIGATTVAAGRAGSVSIMARIHNRLATLVLPLYFTPDLIAVDSVVFGGALPYFLDRYYRVEPAASAVVLQLDCNAGDTIPAAGEYLLAEVHFTADTITGNVAVDAMHDDTLAALLLTDWGESKTPVVQGSTITIEEAVGIDDDWQVEDAGAVVLYQNYPNPFNSVTTVGFGVPRTTEVRLEVYNVLGRRVALLAEGRRVPGMYRVLWKGVDERGLEAPSGVYFYRLQTADTSLVAKMILIK